MHANSVVVSGTQRCTTVTSAHLISPHTEAVPAGDSPVDALRVACGSAGDRAPPRGGSSGRGAEGGVS